MTLQEIKLLQHSQNRDAYQYLNLRLNGKVRAGLGIWLNRKGQVIVYAAYSRGHPDPTDKSLYVIDLEEV